MHKFRYSSLLFALLMIVASSATAQVTDAEKQLRQQRVDSLGGWLTGGLANVNFSQSSFTYWQSGGQNAVGLNGLLSVYAKYKKDSNTWDNLLDLGYGVLRQGKGGGVIKTDDKIDFLSKFGRKAVKHWYYSALVNFKTQFQPGFSYPNDSVRISTFLAPAYVLGAVGMDYKPDNHFSAFISPLTGRVTVVNDQRLADLGSFGVRAAEYDGDVLVRRGAKSRSEFGGYARLMYNRTLFSDQSISVLSKLDLFSNYMDEPSAIDVSWETVIGFKVNRYIAATLTTHLLYDKDIDIQVERDGEMESIGAKTQFKQVLGIGFSYQF